MPKHPEKAKLGGVGVAKCGERRTQFALFARSLGDIPKHPDAALLRALEIDLPGEVVEELVLDDLLIEFRVFATAVLTRYTRPLNANTMASWAKKSPRNTKRFPRSSSMASRECATPSATSPVSASPRVIQR